MSERHVITFRHRGRVVGIDCSCGAGFASGTEAGAGRWAHWHRKLVGLRVIAAARVLRW